MNANPCEVFQSKEDQNPRFSDEYHILQARLWNICTDWSKYLDQYLNASAQLFGISEYPWEKNERVLVGTLAASLIRSNEGAIVAEELPVPKESSANQKGRCDLWAHLPLPTDPAPFNFYLEAKKFMKPRTQAEVEKALSGRGGITRMFFDYAKSRNGRIHENSPYNKMVDRKHPHYIIGMIGLPLKGKIEIKELKNTFEDRFAGVRTVGSGEVRRRLSRFPTQALFFGRHDKANDRSMLATLTVLGKSAGKR